MSVVWVLIVLAFIAHMEGSAIAKNRRAAPFRIEMPPIDPTKEEISINEEQDEDENLRKLLKFCRFKAQEESDINRRLAGNPFVLKGEPQITRTSKFGFIIRIIFADTARDRAGVIRKHICWVRPEDGKLSYIMRGKCIFDNGC